MKNIKIDSLEDLRKILAENTCEETVINLEPKEYELYETIKINRKNFTLKGNGAKILGSKRVDISKLCKKDKIVKISLKDHGISSGMQYGKFPFDWCGKYPELPKDAFGTEIASPLSDTFPKYNRANGPIMQIFSDGEPMPVSRYPECGRIEIEKAFDAEIIEDFKRAPNDIIKNGGNSGAFVPKDANFTSFSKAHMALLFGSFSYDWAPHHHLCKSVDPENNIIKVAPPYDFWGYWDGRGELGEHGSFFCINVFEKLDKEGAYFIDTETEELYVHPYKDQNTVDISVCEDVFFAEGAENIRIENISLSQARGCGFFFKNSRNVSLCNLSLCNVGEWGIIGENCESLQIDSCAVFHTGSGGIFLSGGDREKLISGANAVTNCEISDVAWWYKTYKPGISLSGVGATISGNKIHDLPHSAILFTGNNHVIERNEIYRVCTESNDAGAIYSGRNYSYYGHIIRYNYFHDIYGLDGKGCSCVYFDDCMSSASVYENIFANICISVQLGGGHDIEIRKNTFYNCDLLVVDARGKMGNWAHDATKNMANTLKNSPYKNEIWKKAYPTLCSDDIESNSFLLPLRNRITDNTFIECGDVRFEKTVPREHITYKNNSFVKRKSADIFRDVDTAPVIFYILRDYLSAEED